jgi:hypothetical protein
VSGAKRGPSACATTPSGARRRPRTALSEAARADEAAIGASRSGSRSSSATTASGRDRKATATRSAGRTGAALEHAREGSRAWRQPRRRGSRRQARPGRAYDDDPDAIERLQEKLAGLEARRERMKAANADYRREHRDELAALAPYERGQAVPFPSYALSNLGGVITTTRQRIERLSRPESGRAMVARRAGECRACGGSIEPGQPIRWFRRAGAAEHQECPT